MTSSGIFNPAGKGYRDSEQRRAANRVTACAANSHGNIAASPDAFAAAADNLYLWDEDATGPETRLVGGRCPSCRSDLAVEVPYGHPLIRRAGGWL